MLSHQKCSTWNIFLLLFWLTAMPAVAQELQNPPYGQWKIVTAYAPYGKFTKLGNASQLLQMNLVIGEQFAHFRNRAYRYTDDYCRQPKLESIGPFAVWWKKSRSWWKAEDFHPRLEIGENAEVYRWHCTESSKENIWGKPQNLPLIIDGKKMYIEYMAGEIMLLEKISDREDEILAR